MADADEGARTFEDYVRERSVALQRFAYLVTRHPEDARDAVESGRADAGFFMRATPVEQVREVAAGGESMPPKSTYFYPKVPTGLVLNPLAETAPAR